MKKTIKLPCQKGTPDIQPSVEFEQLVVVGANGSGKTRFGSKIEELHSKKVHRISAQKSLNFNSVISPKSKQIAEQEFRYGVYRKEWNEGIHLSQKNSHRWGKNLNTHLLNDFNQLLVLLHTEEYEESLSYKEGRITKPKTKLDIVQSIWEEILPHRKLYKKAGVIETYPTEQEVNKYNATEMSDGERVIFYLIGSVICAFEDSILIIDEPEIHIHRSLLKKLFDLIEHQRRDCSFIYLTHDIDFAFSRQNAVKIWTKSYEGSDIWDYEILEDETPIPEQLYLRILGSRKKVIFLEGDKNSIDYKLYEQVYTDYDLNPSGSCDKVIQFVKSFNDKHHFHHINSFGIIDRDRRKIDDVKKLNNKNIWVLDVAEAENLLLIEDIVKNIAKHMGKNPDYVFNQVKSNIINFFGSQLNSQILLHFGECFKKQLLNVSAFTDGDISNVINKNNSNFTNIDQQKIYDDIETEFKKILSNSDYNSILRVFNLKKALIPNSQVCELTGLKNQNEYLKLVITLLKKKDQISSTISNSIKQKIIKSSP